MASAGVIAERRLSRHQAWDALFVVLSLTQAALLLTQPSIPVIALGLWWNANTIAHNFLHRPFFRSRALNRSYSVFLSLVLGVPQSVWRDRHLAHHVGRPWRLRFDARRGARDSHRGRQACGRRSRGARRCSCSRRTCRGGSSVLHSVSYTDTTSMRTARRATTGGFTTRCSSTTAITSNIMRSRAGTGPSWTRGLSARAGAAAGRRCCVGSML